MFRRYVLEFVKPAATAIPSGALPSPYFTSLGHLVGGSADIDLPLLQSKVWGEDYKSDVPDFRRNWLPKRWKFDLERDLMAATLLGRAQEFSWRSNGRLWLGLDHAFGATPETLRACYSRPATRDLLRQHVGSLFEKMPQQALLTDLRVRMTGPDLRDLLRDANGGTIPREIDRLLRRVEGERFMRRLRSRFGRRAKP